VAGSCDEEVREAASEVNGTREVDLHTGDVGAMHCASAISRGCSSGMRRPPWLEKKIIGVLAWWGRRTTGGSGSVGGKRWCLVLMITDV
jgi:hypothetical protein